MPASLILHAISPGSSFRRGQWLYRVEITQLTPPPPSRTGEITITIAALFLGKET